MRLSIRNGLNMIKKFLNYVEVRTKITSLFAFLMSLAYLSYKEIKINAFLTIIFFLSMFLFDITTTAINNYIDSKHDSKGLPFKRNTAFIIILVLLAISTLLGLYLAYLTDVVVLIAGGICFIYGVLYTYGPLPISRLPLGEVFSGFFYGVMIPFIIFHINMPQGHFFLLKFSLSSISLEINVVPCLILLIFAIVPFCTTAGIMLANNICDLEADIKVKRHTLPYFIGKKTAITLFGILYYSCYVAIVLMVILKILPVTCLLTLVTFYPVQKNITLFREKQEKSLTFIVSIKNYLMIMGSTTVFIYIGTILF